MTEHAHMLLQVTSTLQLPVSVSDYLEAQNLCRIWLLAFHRNLLKEIDH